jgi:uncharacterized protein with PIN domain
MLNSGKCPKCEKTVSKVRLEAVDVNVGFTKEYRGVSYCCVGCGAVLGVGIDPVALMNDTVSKTMQRLGRG